jgi:hypothetical protein
MALNPMALNPMALNPMALNPMALNPMALNPMSLPRARSLRGAGGSAVPVRRVRAAVVPRRLRVHWPGGRVPHPLRR